jgi:hypothetical protein
MDCTLRELVPGARCVRVSALHFVRVLPMCCLHGMPPTPLMQHVCIARAAVGSLHVQHLRDFSTWALRHHW